MCKLVIQQCKMEATASTIQAQLVFATDVEAWRVKLPPLRKNKMKFTTNLQYNTRDAADMLCAICRICAVVRTLFKEHMRYQHIHQCTAMRPMMSCVLSMPVRQVFEVVRSKALFGFSLLHQNRMMILFSISRIPTHRCAPLSKD